MTTTSKTRPTHKLYSLCKLKDGKSSWTEPPLARFQQDVAFAHRDGNGFVFRMTAMPAPGGEFVMRRDTSKPSNPA
jgi:hypothetical protein